MLERMDQDMDCSFKQSVLVPAALHPVGHLLAIEMVSTFNYVVEKIKMDDCACF